MTIEALRPFRSNAVFLSLNFQFPAKSAEGQGKKLLPFGLGQRRRAAGLFLLLDQVQRLLRVLSRLFRQVGQPLAALGIVDDARVLVYRELIRRDRFGLLSR